MQKTAAATTATTAAASAAAAAAACTTAATAACFANFADPSSIEDIHTASCSDGSGRNYKEDRAFKNNFSTAAFLGTFFGLLLPSSLIDATSLTLF